MAIPAINHPVWFMTMAVVDFPREPRTGFRHRQAPGARGDHQCRARSRAAAEAGGAAAVGGAPGRRAAGARLVPLPERDRRDDRGVRRNDLVGRGARAEVLGPEPHRDRLRRRLARDLDPGSLVRGLSTRYLVPGTWLEIETGEAL